MKYLLFFASLLAFTACTNQETTDNAQIETDISPVIPQTSGSVIRILVSDNQRVQLGDTILLLDDRAARIAVGQAEVALAQAKQHVILAQTNTQASSGVVTTATASSEVINATIQTAKSAVDAAEVNLKLAQKNFVRINNLVRQEAATVQQLDVAQAQQDGALKALDQAKAQLEAAKRQAVVSQREINVRRWNQTGATDNVALAELAVKQAIYQLEAAKLQLSHCVITSPATGVISKKSVQVGQVVSVGQPLMAITSTDSVWVVANFKETQLAHMRVGQAAEIRLDAFEDSIITGNVLSFSQATGAKFSLLPPDNATGNFVKVTQRVPVKIALDRSKFPTLPLQAGLSATVTIKTDQ